MLFSELKCREPLNLDNANFAPIHESYEIGAVVTYACAEGYDSEEEIYITCLTSQNWTQISSSCEGMGIFPPNELTQFYI